LAVAYFFCATLYRLAQKSKPLPNYPKIVLTRIKVCQWDQISSSH